MSFAQSALTRDRFLDGKLQLWQPKDGYRAATDPVLLAAACPARIGETVLDLGCGVGTAALCLSSRIEVRATGIELLEDYVELAVRNAKDNQLSLDVVAGNIADPPERVRERSFDHVITNPPFFGPGASPEDEGRAVGRQELSDIATWIDAGLKRLKPGGWITLIHLVERLPEVIVALNGRAGAIAIKPLAARNTRAPKRFILRARKGSRGRASLSNALILHSGPVHSGDRDDYTPAAKAILRDGAPLEF